MTTIQICFKSKRVWLVLKMNKLFKPFSYFNSTDFSGILFTKVIKLYLAKVPSHRFYHLINMIVCDWSVQHVGIQLREYIWQRKVIQDGVFKCLNQSLSLRQYISTGVQHPLYLYFSGLTYLDHTPGWFLKSSIWQYFFHRNITRQIIL